MNNQKNIVFVYHKDGKIKVLDLHTSYLEDKNMLSDGWQHTSTLNACMFIEYLFNQCEDVDIISEIRDLKSKAK